MRSIPRGSRAALALMVAAVAAWACDAEEEGIGPCKGEELGFRCTIEGKAGVCIHNCGSELMCVTDGRREDADNSCVDGVGDAGRKCPTIGDPPECIKAGEACTGGLCAQDADGCASCHFICDVPGEACQINDVTQGVCYFPSTHWEAVCYPAGTLQAGEACVEPNDCAPGGQCMEQHGMMNCYLLCTDTCATGTCTDTGLGFRVCVEGETLGD